MSLEQWSKNGWLRPHKTSTQEIAGLLAIVDRDLKVLAWLKQNHPALLSKERK